MRNLASRVGGSIATHSRRAGARVAGTLVRVATDVPAVALTFDDGPDPVWTPAFLEILNAHKARATFFMIGQNAAEYPDIVKSVAESGHVVGNHTWDHPRMPRLTAGERRRQLRACERATAPYGQAFFRPPHTLQSIGSYLTARRLGYEIVAWSAEVEDWRAHDADWLTTRLLARIAPGRIVVLHDSLWDSTAGAEDRGPAFSAVRATLSELTGRFQFVTVPELIQLGRPVRKIWFYASDDDWPRKESEMGVRFGE